MIKLIKLLLRLRRRRKYERRLTYKREALRWSLRHYTNSDTLDYVIESVKILGGRCRGMSFFSGEEIEQIREHLNKAKDMLRRRGF